MPKPKSKRRVFRRVDVWHNKDDHMCFVMLMLGRSNEAIMRKTSLSPGQIYYRSNLFGISRQDYRNGKSTFSKKVDVATEQLVEAALMEHVRQQVSHYNYG